jgi:CubicO group peptidase (beta-lactamase class C family)
MTSTVTDGWIVTQRGKVLEEHYYSGMTPDSSHLLMSVSKSMVGIVAGALTASGALDVDAPLT